MPFLTPDDPGWTDALARLRYDVYHLPGYVALSARWEKGKPRAFRYDDEGSVALLPLVVREMGEGVCDAASPYGYPSPLFSDGAGPGFQREALQAFADEGRATGLVSSFLRLHPLLQPSLPESREASWSVVEHGPTVALDLAEPHAAWLRRLSRNHRRSLRALIEEGYTVQVGAPNALADLAEIYAETMERLGAAASYRFPLAYFRELAASLGDHHLVVTVRAPLGGTAAAGVFTHLGPVAQAHLSGTSHRHLAASPSKLLFVGARAELARRGAAVLHLGGGFQSKHDALLRFKRGFAGEDRTFASARFVHHREAYERLSREALALAPEQPIPPADFFPSYRQHAAQ